MTSCHEMKLGQVYRCENCGLELEVVGQCRSYGMPAEDCECVDHCRFECCGEPLKLVKES